MHRLKTIIIIVAVLLGVASCAKQGMPSGGPKDTQPPKSKNMSPENRSLNFSANGFYMEFDEYVVLKDAENNILVSPPMKEKPEYRTKGKGIQVKIKDTLQPNTTYQFQFKDAIADFNEGNLLPSVEYVFSTGDYIDSMTVRGKVVDAQSMKAMKEKVEVWLYDEEGYRAMIAAISDTAAPKIVPKYITRSDKDGNFCFNNIKPGKYRVLAIVDGDKNLLPGVTESTAFLDSAIIAVGMRDSVKVDSIQRSMADMHPIDIRIFTPDNTKQRIIGSDFVSSGKVRLTSALPMKDPVIDGGGEALTWRLNSGRDTLTLWTFREKCDSLHLVVSDPSGIQDTLKLRWRAKKGRGNQNINKPSQQQFVDMKISTKKMHYYDTLALLFSTPLDTKKCSLDSAVSVRDMKDSSVVFSSAVIDSSGMKVWILYPFVQGGGYEIEIAKGFFHDIYSHINDSLRVALTVTKAEDYGKLSIKIAADSACNYNGHLIVELLDEKEAVKSRKYCHVAQKVELPNIMPGKYRVRATMDTNGNGKWDSGDLVGQRQPERVVYLDKSIDIRAKWEFEEILTIRN
ncbi:MAG: Ig-like domain-containing protein [Bacteroidales bacterium]|nr:Ig-like domain-containing protein [Bacteroidales bacterium]